jgi:hypothetical protein
MTLDRQWKFSLRSSNQSLVIAVSVGLLAFGTYLWQLTVPIYLQLYDSGVYAAAALHFVSGAMPYRDFVFVQPPGILLVMSPMALFSRVFGSHDGFVLARVMTALVTALNASLLAWLVRPRGRIAMLIAGCGLALTPVAVFFSSGVRLEPYCICFVLLGSLTIYSDDGKRGQLSARRLAVGGLFFGLAALIEFWAFFPFLALVICLIPSTRNRVFVFIGAAGTTFVALALPFFLSSPKNFVAEVFREQISRPGGSESILWRIRDMTGFSATSIAPTTLEAVVAFSIFILVSAFVFRYRFDFEVVDTYLLFAVLISVLGLLAAPTAYTDYSYFAQPFLFGLLGVCVARLGVLSRTAIQRVNVSIALRGFVAYVGVLTGALLVIALILYVTTFYSIDERLLGKSATSITQITSHIPSGSCVVYSEVGVGVLANRVLSRNPHCPDVVDPFGTSMAWDYELSRPAPTFVAEWKSYLAAAQYAVLEGPVNDSILTKGGYSYTYLIPWNRTLIAWFATRFHLISGNSALYIYEKDADH